VLQHQTECSKCHKTMLATLEELLAHEDCCLGPLTTPPLALGLRAAAPGGDDALLHTAPTGHEEAQRAAAAAARAPPAAADGHARVEAASPAAMHSATFAHVRPGGEAGMEPPASRQRVGVARGGEMGRGQGGVGGGGSGKEPWRGEAFAAAREREEEAAAAAADAAAAAAAAAAEEAVARKAEAEKDALVVTLQASGAVPLELDSSDLLSRGGVSRLDTHAVLLARALLRLVSPLSRLRASSSRVYARPLPVCARAAATAR